MNPNKPKAPSLSGRTDLPLEFSTGIIRVRIACGRSIGDVIQRHGLPGPASYWSPPPFDAHDRRAGLDRSFRIGVEPGYEKQWVQRLAPESGDFDWVLLDWHYPVHLQSYVPPATQASVAGVARRPQALLTSDPMWSQQLNLQRANFASAWDRTVSFKDVVVGIIDSGITATHEDLGTWKQYTGYDYVQGIEVPPGTAVDSGCDGGHGTHVASIAAGDTNNG